MGATRWIWHWLRQRHIENNVPELVATLKAIGDFQSMISLKLIKRQMYGRAKLDLLQARVVGAI
ncbi:hypothetical protein [Novosphingobium sp. Rr 2-17]|uniref:hypothetical protein n=1 Tax=Novosphingobium sp. Rr 2-17 TaxID=555793 RepID=UPI0002F3497A|nr:hypothetical protein [Novosphingobium sp. Rr 2-17]